MDEEDSAAITIGDDGSEEDSEIDMDFEFDDEIKQSLNSLLNIPLEFMPDSSEEEEETHQKTGATEKSREDSVERQLEALFVEEKERPRGQEDNDEDIAKDTGLENISDNELDGPESGECDTSDGELPDSPSIVVTLPETPPNLQSKIQGVVDISADEESDVEVVGEYTNRSRTTGSQKVNGPKSDREVLIEKKGDADSLKNKDKKEKDLVKLKERSGDKSKKEKNKKKSESGNIDDDLKRKQKLKKYLARLDQYRTKCLEYMGQISKKCDLLKKEEKNKIKLEKSKIRSLIGDNVKVKSIVAKINKGNEPAFPTSSKRDVSSHAMPSNPSVLDKVSHITEDESKKRKSSFEKERSKEKSKERRSKSKELKEHKLKYQQYIQYLQAERMKCHEERLALDRQKNKSKHKHRKSESSSPEKVRDKTPVLEGSSTRAPVLTFAEFCNSREIASPDREPPKPSIENGVRTSTEGRKERTMSIDSLATTSTARSDQIDHVDDDKELFITYSDLVEQDKIKETKQLEERIEKDPALASISVFTGVLFKGSADANGIPFLQEGQPPSPKIETFKPKFTHSSGPDEIYDWNDDLSTISQSSLSPSRSPPTRPKVHNKALLNFIENNKERIENRKPKLLAKKTKLSRSRSKSPRKDRQKKRRTKHHSSISISPSPPPLKPRSPEIYKKKPSPPAYLKERWKDYPSPPPGRRREHFERRPRSRRRSRSRTRGRPGHRSRSSSEEIRYRRYRSKSRSRSRSRSPPQLTMVQLSTSEKRRKLKEEHERALASLRATIRKPLSTTPLSITFTAEGDNYEPIRDNYDPVVMNEVG